MANNYFDFLEQSAQQDKPANEAPQNDGTVNLTVRADAECQVVCDGDFLFLLNANQLVKEKAPVGQHLLQFISTDYPDICIEKVVDFAEPGKNYLVLVNEFKAQVADFKKKEAERKAKEEAERIVTMAFTAKQGATIDKNVKEATKVEKRGILKQDFETLEKEAYVPTDSEISVSIGVDIARKQNVILKFNSEEFIHAFILGQSGSGKSVLLNNIISSAILKYSPQDLVLYLMDFKGVEFNRYRGEKHTKAVLDNNSDPKMTLEVLRELREENKKRVKLWQREGVNNIDRYNKKYPDARLPQILFVADECQVLFQNPRTGGVQMAIHREISDILNTIATQGRSQGIHMLLATQQLGETDISDQVLKNLTECLLLMSAPSDSNRLVPDSSDLTAKQATGLACYYHKKELKGQVQTFYASDDELEMAILSAQKKAERHQR